MSGATQQFQNGSLLITVVRSATVTTISWSGESDARTPGEFLNPIVSKLAKDLSGLDVSIDFSQLTYMNSATVAPLITCIKALDATASSVLVVFSDMDWQRTHVQCVRTISRQLKKVRIEVRGKSESAE